MSWLCSVESNLTDNHISLHVLHNETEGLLYNELAPGQYSIVNTTLPPPGNVTQSAFIPQHREDPSYGYVLKQVRLYSLMHYT